MLGWSGKGKVVKTKGRVCRGRLSSRKCEFFCISMRPVDRAIKKNNGNERIWAVNNPLTPYDYATKQRSKTKETTYMAAREEKSGDQQGESFSDCMRSSDRTRENKINKARVKESNSK